MTAKSFLMFPIIKIFSFCPIFGCTMGNILKPILTKYVVKWGYCLPSKIYFNKSFKEVFRPKMTKKVTKV